MRTSIIKKYGLLFLFLLSVGSVIAADFSVEKLQTNHLINPLGIDSPIPRFSWQMSSNLRNQKQIAYQLIVASDLSKLASGVGDIWDSNKTLSEQSNNIVYAGSALSSKTDYFWKTRVWNQDGEVSEWSAPARFGTAMFSPDDWTAKWIMSQDEVIAYPSVEVLFDEPILARYVQLNIAKIGIPVDESGKWRVQLAEIQAFGPNSKKNLALNQSVTFSDEFIYGPWKAANLTDGVVYSSTTSAGACSNTYNSSTPTSPVIIRIDLGSEMMVDRVILYPRTDVSSKDNANLVGNFPKNYTIQTKGTSGTFYIDRKKIVNQSTPQMVLNKSGKRLPMFGKSFTITKPVKSAKVYSSGLGLFEMSVNGKRVTDNVLEPGESAFDATVLYATYDITDKLSEGKNAIVTRMGNGMYNNQYVKDRYQKLNVSFGPLRFIAQIEITYEDGTKDVLATGQDWKSSSSPITTSAWYGGEDYDARLEQAEIDESGFSFDTWNPVALYPGKSGVLRAQFYQPTTVTESWKAVKVTNPAMGVYVVDFGRNFAGQYEFTMKADPGVSIKLYPSEILYPSGRINQSIVSPSYNSYIFNGKKEGETWSPKFVYHGLRYLEIIGLPFEPTPDMFTAKLIRAGTEKIGSFNTSNYLLNEIDVIITRAIESNMYNTLTDCPHREKLGWLEVPNLMYNSINDVYDMSAWMPKISMDIKDTQQASGFVATTAPEFAVFGSPFRDEPTWSASTIIVPWQSYVTYGDMKQMEDAYPVMVKLMNYYATKSKVYLLDYGLGDWGSYDKTTSVGFTVSCTYYHLATVMSNIAKVLNKTTDETTYATLANNIKKALNGKYFKNSTKNYDSGSQASNALALYYDIVADEDKDIVIENLIKTVKASDYHLTTGEIALKPLLLSLAQNGHNDIVYKMATQKTMPSYGYFIEKGCTTLPEYWDMQGSLNHCMMGHIEGWFYEYLAGIRNNDIAFKKTIIQPYFAPELNHIDVSTRSVYGKIRSSWVRNGDKSVSAEIEIPTNTTATLYFPVKDVKNITENGAPLAVNNGIHAYLIENGQIKIEVGSGNYSFRLLDIGQSLQELNATITKAEKNIQSNVKSGWEVFQTALTQAKSLVNKLESTQQQIDAAISALVLATENLVLKNIALKKSPIHSSSYEEWGWESAKLVDGEVVATHGYSSVPSEIQHEEWVGVDFDYAYQFNKVKCYPRYINNIAETFPLDFELQISPDGTNWETVVSKTNYPLPSNPSQAEEFTFPAVKSQYMRVCGRKLRPFSEDGNKYYFQLMEIDVCNE